MNIKNNKGSIQYKMIAFAIILIVLCLRQGITSYAASATIQITSKEEEVTVGNSVSVVLTVDSDVNIGDFETFITYDSDLLEFKSGGAFINGDDGLLKISDTNTEDTDRTKKYVMEFIAKKVGVSEIAIRDKAMVYDYEEGLEMSVSSNSLFLSVKSSKTSSTNANLKTLKISPGTLIPEFSSNITKYTTTVNSDIAELIVSGVTEDENANVTVTGATKLNSGENTVKVKVTAESGNIKEYSIMVTKEEATSNNDQTSDLDNNGEDSSPQDDEDRFKAVNEDGNIFIENSYRLQVMPVDPDTVVPSGYEKTSLILDDITITAYELENNVENDFFLIYAMNEEGDKQFYQYDRVEKTMQRYFGSSITSGNKTNTDNQTMSSNKYQNKLVQLSLIIVILSALIIILIIIIIRLFIKRKGYHGDDLD